MDNEKIVEKLTAVVAQTENNTQQIVEVKEDIKELKEENKALSAIATNLEVMSQSVNFIKEDVAAVKDGQKQMQDKIACVENESIANKAKTYDKIRDLVITAAASGIVGFILAQIAPSIWGH